MSSRRRVFLLAAIALIASGAALCIRHRRLQMAQFAAASIDSGAVALDVGHPTFSRDIAPIVFANCSECHRPGGVGPFNLLTFEDVRKRARHIADLTSRRIMPPWMPARDCGPFVGERELSDRQIAMIQQWASDGAPEGDPTALPPAPHYNDDWALGPPDLVVKLPEPFIVPAEGKDVYQNFVLPVGLDAPRSVRAVELRSGNARVVHHGSLLVDATGSARARAQSQGATSYRGMSPGDGVTGVQGRFMFWQPGSPACIQNENEPWALPAGANLVLQLHLRPTGKPEPLQPTLGLYFTPKPPSKLFFKLMLRSTSIDIPAGSTDYSFESSYTLPVDADAIAVSEHAHYLGNHLVGYAILPDGRRVELLDIPKWNFYWQGGYRYVRPLPLPRGTVLRMHFTYDNSARNPDNPTTPPRRVIYGLNSDDEMGEFWVVFRLRDAADYAKLAQDYIGSYGLPDGTAQLQTQIRLNPKDADLHAELAGVFLTTGRTSDAVGELQTALSLNSNCGKAHRYLANILMKQGDIPRAIEHFRAAVKADPSDFDSQADLGLAIAAGGDLSDGADQLRLAIQLNPRDALTHTNLGRVYLLQHKMDQAKAELAEALRLDPEQPLARRVMRDAGFGP